MQEKGENVEGAQESYAEMIRMMSWIGIVGVAGYWS